MTAKKPVKKTGGIHRKKAVTRPEKKADRANAPGDPAKCPSCGRPVGARSKACPACGAVLDPASVRQG